MGAMPNKYLKYHIKARFMDMAYSQQPYSQCLFSLGLLTLGNFINTKCVKRFVRIIYYVSKKSIEKQRLLNYLFLCMFESIYPFFNFVHISVETNCSVSQQTIKSQIVNEKHHKNLSLVQLYKIHKSCVTLSLENYMTTKP